MTTTFRYPGNNPAWIPVNAGIDHNGLWNNRAFETRVSRDTRHRTMAPGEGPHRAGNGRSDYQQREQQHNQTVQEQQKADEIAAAHLQAQEEMLMISESVRSANHEQNMRAREAPRSPFARSPTPHRLANGYQNIPIAAPIPSTPQHTVSAPAFRDMRPPSRSHESAVSRVASNPAEALRVYEQLLTGNRRCWRCQASIQTYPTTGEGQVGWLLHSTCIACSKTQCRGCSTPTPNCGPRCAGRECLLTTCCQEIRAIAIFEILSDFDKQYSAGAARLSGSGIWPVPRREREDLLQLVTSRVDRETSVKFNQLLFNTLAAINSWLLPENTEQQIHPSVGLLLSSSFLFEVVHGFLNENYHHNWVINGNVYTQIMKLLRLIGNRHCLQELLHGRLPFICVSSGIQVWMWYPGQSVWECDQSHNPLYNAVFSNDAQQAVARLETILRRQDLRNLIADIREDFQRLTILAAGGPELP